MDHAAIPEIVAKSREAQGLPPKVTDRAVIAAVATIIGKTRAGASTTPAPTSVLTNATTVATTEVNRGTA